jgi:peptide/nickel transport system substrate-binding protein
VSSRRTPPVADSRRARPHATRALHAALTAALALLPGCGPDRPPGRQDSAAGVAPRAAPREVGAPPRPGEAPTGGALVIATAADAETLFPPTARGITARQVTDLVFETLAEIGGGLNTIGDAGFRPQLAQRWTWARDSLAITFHLDPRARWHDGAPVTAEDVRFTFGVYRDPAAGAMNADKVTIIDSVATPDAHTAVFWFARRSPEQFYSAAALMRVLPAHVLRGIPAARLAESAAARRPVGTGRFRFAGWDPQARIELVADSAHYRARARLDRVVWTVTPDAASAAARLLTGEADLYESVRPEQLAAVARRPALTTLPYPGLQYGYLLFNLRGGPPGTPGFARGHPLFGEPALRRALAQALDREAMVRNVFDTLARVLDAPRVGAWPTPAAAAPPLPFDPAAARRALDALGWRAPAPGATRARGGRPLAFTILVPRSSETRVRLAVLAQAQLRAVGVEARVEPLEFTAFVGRMTDRRFDAAMGSWLADPSPWDVEQVWGGAAARTPRSVNAGGYASPAFDALVDGARWARTPAAARALFGRAQQQITADAPAVWLFEPRPAMALARRLRPAGVRADAWWAGLADWWVEPSRRVARDRAGAR